MGALIGLEMIIGQKIADSVDKKINKLLTKSKKEVKMVKVKDIKTRKPGKKARITVKSLIVDVRKKLNKEKVTAVMSLLENKYRELESAKVVVKKITKQIKAIEEKDIEEIETEDYLYDEEE